MHLQILLGRDHLFERVSLKKVLSSGLPVDVKQNPVNLLRNVCTWNKSSWPCRPRAGSNDSSSWTNAPSVWTYDSGGAFFTVCAT